MEGSVIGNHKEILLEKNAIMHSYLPMIKRGKAVLLATLKEDEQGKPTGSTTPISKGKNKVVHQGENLNLCFHTQFG